MNKITHALMSILFTPVYDNRDILVCYASQTGTAENLALQSGRIIAKTAKSVEVQSLSALHPSDLNEYNQVVMIISTCGEGEIPDQGKLFYQQLCDLPELSSNISILALGDKSYQHFCLAGKLFQHELVRLGRANNPEPTMVSGDPLETWQTWLSQQLNEDINTDQVQRITTPVTLTLTKREALHNTSLNVSESASQPNKSGSANQAYQLVFDIQQDDEHPYQINDLVSIVPPGSDKERLYSIASSPSKNPHQLSLCIAKHQFLLDGEWQNGKCSHHLIEQIALGSRIEGFIKTGKGMPLPNNQQDTILIATGAGIAPMMSLLEERKQQQHLGKNWFIFGNRYSNSDFYYREDIQQYISEGIVHQLDTAFSRDSEEKQYVQDKLVEHQQQLADWIINRHANIYVCGRPELKDEITTIIEQALIRSSLTEEEAKQTVNTMRQNEQLIFELF